MNPKSAKFAGFPSDTLKFFRALKRNNDRDWFLPRKEIFESKVRAPMFELVDALNADLAGFAPDYINDPKKAVYRIYRDVRFSADKSPYKTHLAAIFPRRARAVPGAGGDRGSSPGFYFSISAEGVGVAGGLYEPQPDQIVAVRSWLAENHAAFSKACRAPEKLMGKMEGESLKRVPKGFDPEHPAGELLKMKRWVFYTKLPAALITSPKLQGELAKRFQSMLPALELLSAAAGRPRKMAASDFM
jgi:uncharacterized protein (TIGR02453 family)